MRASAALLLAWCTACASLPPPEEEIAALERTRFAAMTRADVAALDAMLGEDLVYCHSTGWCETKTEHLDTLRSGRIRYRAIEPVELRVRALRDSVVVNGTIAVDGTAGGKPVHMRLSYTDVYARRNGRWLLIAWQSTQLP